tara:strand:- start:215 stop:994 length:780 start_codon:yes stop_codon:yes gene_type:complete
MAIDINRVYQKVLALANKEQRGYITPQEFNLFADRAQNEIYENYFQQLNMAQVKPKSQGSHIDPVEVIERKLEPFKLKARVGFHGSDHPESFNHGVATQGYSSTTAPASQSNFFLPFITNSSAIVKIIDPDTGNLITKVSEEELANLNSNALTKPTLRRQVFTIFSNNIGLKIVPPPLQDKIYEVIYYNIPFEPLWGYVVVSGKALHNAGTSQNFQLLPSEEENLVSRILIMAGITLKQPDLQQAGVGSIQLNKQEQNN